MQKLFSHRELDAILDVSREHPERFEALTDHWVRRLDSEGYDLEVSDAVSWRKAERSAKTSFIQQFRSDVEGIITLDREGEGRLARRIEFARKRNEIAQATDGIARERLLRRAMELHALRSEMVERNLYLVLINVERYYQTQSSRMDLIQEGCVSLFRAVDGFDWRRGLLFRTYAVHWLNQAFRNYLYNNGTTVRVPVYLQKALRKVSQASGRIGKEHASLEELSKASDQSESVVESALSAARTTYSLDSTSNREDGPRLRDHLADQRVADSYSPLIESVSLSGGLDKALGALGDRERTVLGLRFGIGVDKEYTLSEVAVKLGVSVERIRQIQVRALAKLDTPTARRELEPFMN